MSLPGETTERHVPSEFGQLSPRPDPTKRRQHGGFYIETAMTLSPSPSDVRHFRRRRHRPWYRRLRRAIFPETPTLVQIVLALVVVVSLSIVAGMLIVRGG